MKPAASIKYLTYFLTYNGLLFFAMAFAPFGSWLAFQNGHYGIWRACVFPDGCVLQGWSPGREAYTAQVVPRILMLVALGLLLIAGIFGFRGFRYENAAVSFLLSGVIQFFSSIFIAAAFLVSYFAPVTKDGGRGKIVFQSVIAMVCAALFAVSGMISLGLFCYQKIHQANSVIMLDKKGRAEYVHGQDVAYYDE